MGTYSFTGAPQFVTVGQTGTYDINAFGARGGSSSTYGTTGGNGAEAGGNFALTAGEKLEIVVGGTGGSSNYGGGGGGSFVLANTGPGGAYVPLLVAGGGGGAYRANGGAGTVGAPGNGSGGGVGGAYGGGGGAGVQGNGTSTNSLRGYGGRGGSNGSGGYAGGAGGFNAGAGGFGGGGGGGGDGGGGGGGYTGGAGSSGNPGNGVGGTSYDAGTPIAAQTMAGQNAGVGRVLITPNVTCYTTGTGIRVIREGVEVDVPVEDLCVGDRAVTASGTQRPITWIGHQAVDCTRHADPRQAWPVRVRAGAFGRDVAGQPLPCRDLVVSPDHALAIGPEHGLAAGPDGDADPILVPAFALLNGATVVRAPMDAVTYWHVELAGGHGLLVAEGLAAESYLDCGNRGFFAGVDVVGEAPATDPGLAAPGSCLERTDDAARLAPVRAWMRDRALALGWRLDAADPFAGLRLVVDGLPVLPETDGLSACFLVPAGARDVALVSGSSVPWEVSGAGDARSLGLCVAGLNIVDGWGASRAIPLDDARLGAGGWHGAEAHGAGHLRWTSGRARLPAALWAGLRGAVFLRVDLACASLPAWRAPAGPMSTAAAGGGHLRALAAIG